MSVLQRTDLTTSQKVQCAAAAVAGQHTRVLFRTLFRNGFLDLFLVERSSISHIAPCLSESRRSADSGWRAHRHCGDRDDHSSADVDRSAKAPVMGEQGRAAAGAPTLCPAPARGGAPSARTRYDLTASPESSRAATRDGPGMSEQRPRHRARHHNTPPALTNPHSHPISSPSTRVLRAKIAPPADATKSHKTKNGRAAAGAWSSGGDTCHAKSA